MSSNLKVNSLVPATGTAIGIGTTGGTIDFRCPATFGGNVTIGGTLTYDEVINIDSIGIVTARSGLKVTGGQLDVGSNIKAGNAGVITATSFSGSGASLTGLTAGQIPNLAASKITSGTVATARLGSGTANNSSFLRGDQTWAVVTSTTINNNANNRIVTGSGTANTLEAETSLEWDGTDTLKVIHGSSYPDFKVKSSAGGGTIELFRCGNGPFRIGNTTQSFYSAADDLTIGGGSGDKGITIYSGSSDAGLIVFADGTSDPAYRMGQIIYDHSSNAMSFRTNGNTERFRITSGGKFGFGTDSPDQTVHIHKGSAGSVSSTANTVLTLENSTTNILQFLNPNNTAAQVRFGDPQDDGSGFIEYSHSADTMSFGANGPTRMQLDGNGHLGIAVASVTQLANSKQLTLRPTDGDGIRLIRPGDGNNSPNVHLDVTTTTSGSSLRSGGEAYTTKYQTYNCDMLFRSYLGGGTGGIIRLMTADGSSGTTRYWQIDEKGKTEHRSRSTSVKTHEFTYTDGAGGGVQTVSLCTLSNYSGSSTAVAEVTYVGSYGLANDYVHSGKWICGIRRASSNSSWSATANETANGGSSSASLDIQWNNGVLQAVTVGAWMGWTVHVTVTTYNFDLTVNV